MTTPIQFGVRFPWPGRRNPQRRVEQFKNDTFTARQSDSAKEIYEALAQPLFEDKYGPFRGWDLLLMLKKARDSQDDIHKSRFLREFAGLDCQPAVSSLLEKFDRVGLLSSKYYSSYWRITETGFHSLKAFKKDFKKGGLLNQRRGNYTVNPTQQ